MIVLSIGAVSAQDADDAIASGDDEAVIGDSEPTISGSVSGGVDVVTENPWTNNGELSYNIPSDAKSIKSADVYVNVYGVRLDDSMGVITNTTISSDLGQITYNESLCCNASDKTVVYKVGDHATKSNLDYMIHYNITSQLAGLNGTVLKIKVNSSAMPGKESTSNLGYIKLIGLVVAYDDGDSDVINYWINDNQIWTNSTATLTYDTTSLTDVLEMSLTNIALVSSDATYKINGQFLTDPQHKSGNYYQYNKWDVTDYFNSTRKTEILAIGAKGYAGVSYKQALSVLTAKKGEIEANVLIKDERNYNGNHIAYAGTYNQITVTVNTNKNGKYTVQLFADGKFVNSTEVQLTAGSTDVKIIDGKIRTLNDTTVVNNNKYENVTYTAKLLLKDELINESSLKVKVLYNGYFAKDLSYPGQDYVSFYNGTITGDLKYLVSETPYASGSNGRIDNWTVTLPANSNFVKAWIYVPYCYGSNDGIDSLNVTFNGAKPAVVSFIRDQPNIPSTSGYGVIVYDVTDLIKSGENILVLNKTRSTATYPSTLLYLYNTTGSKVVKDVYITNCADLLGSTGNAAKRNITFDTILNVDSSKAINATAYIFGAGCKDDRASIIINGQRDDNVWNEAKDTNQINVYTKDMTSLIKDSNTVSLILNHDMFLALQQIVVVTKVKEDPTPVPPAPELKKATITAKKATFKAKKKVKKYAIALKSGKTPIKSAKVTLKIGKKTFKATTNAKGKAIFKIKKLSKKGKYKAVVKFAGNSDYKAASKKVKITLK